MSFKDWPYWLKGGIIGLIILFILYIFSYFSHIISNINLEFIFTFTINILAMPTFLVITRFVTDKPTLFLLIPSIIIYYFLIGVIVGWIIGKIKR